MGWLVLSGVLLGLWLVMIDRIARYQRELRIKEGIARKSRELLDSQRLDKETED